MRHRRAPSRSGRRIVATTFVLVVLAAIVYGLDWGSRIRAQDVVEQSIKHRNPAPATVDVKMEGAFFLPQMARGRYEHVHVSLTDVETDGLKVQAIDADLYGVRVPLAWVLRRSVAVVRIDRSKERALITYPALNNYLKATGEPITASDGPDGQLLLHANFETFGQHLAVAADARISAGPGYLEVEPTSFDTGSAILDQASSVLLKVRLAFQVPTSPLPFGQQVQSIRATPAGVVVTATGTQVVVFPGAMTGHS